MSHSFVVGDSIGDYLDRYERNELLRFLTCGSVDDGKSTLIGRLLHDTGRLYDDHLKSIEAESRVHGTQGGALDLALVVDGLKAEREQGITIDVAYRYFATARRSFIIADCPGHEQYTRNMATGASHCQLAITLIDARNGVTTQTRRHAFIASLLGLRHVVAAVNKMDLVGWSESRFREIEAEFVGFCAKLGIEPVAIPVSALTGENVVKRGSNTPWHSGSPLMELLESVRVEHASPDAPMRLPVQYVIRPTPDFRGFAGTIASGSIKVGDRVRILPSGKTSRVRRMARAAEDGGDRPLAVAGESIVMTLEDEVDCSRGNVIAGISGSNEPLVAQSIEADVVWMHESPLTAGKSLLIRCATQSTTARVVRVRHRVNIDTLGTEPTESLGLNDIGRIEIETENPLVFDPFNRVKGMGSIILIDRLTNATAGAGMIRTGDAADPHAKRAHWETVPVSTLQSRVGQSSVTADQRALRWNQRPVAVLFFGPTGSGKSRSAFELERHLWDAGHAAIVIDGQMLRAGLSKDLSFTDEDRSENLRRAAEFAKILMDQGLVVILSLAAPQADARERARELIGADRYLAVECDGKPMPIDAALVKQVMSLIQRPAAG